MNNKEIFINKLKKLLDEELKKIPTNKYKRKKPNKEEFINRLKNLLETELKKDLENKLKVYKKINE